MDWCSSCGSRTPGDATFCPSCGLRLPIDGAQRTVEAALTGAAAGGIGTGAATPPAASPRGWYPDPAAAAPLRWWTGEAWSAVVNSRAEGPPAHDRSWTQPSPAAWLPDPSGQAPWRWWDGTAFANHLSEGTSVWQDAGGGRT